MLSKVATKNHGGQGTLKGRRTSHARFWGEHSQQREEGCISYGKREGPAPHVRGLVMGQEVPDSKETILRSVDFILSTVGSHGRVMAGSYPGSFVPPYVTLCRKETRDSKMADQC
jgi:hypothetical protein